MQIVEQIKGASEATAGAALAGLGGVGATVQIVTQFGNMLVMFGNLFLVAAGVWLFFHNRRNQRRRDRRGSDMKEGD